MARLEDDREDLIREATALRRRARFVRTDILAELVAGVRENGWISLYFEADPVYQFDADHRLRRAFVEGKLYRSQGTSLAELTRVRAAQATELRRRDLSAGELSAFLNAMTARLADWHTAARQRRVRAVQEVPHGAGVADELLARLAQIVAREPALAPAIRGKR